MDENKILDEEQQKVLDFFNFMNEDNKLGNEMFQLAWDEYQRHLEIKKLK